MAISIVLMAALTLPLPPENTVVWEKVDSWSVSRPMDVSPTMSTCNAYANRSEHVKMKCFVMERQAALEMKRTTIKTGETK